MRIDSILYGKYSRLPPRAFSSILTSRELFLFLGGRCCSLVQTLLRIPVKVFLAMKINYFSILIDNYDKLQCNVIINETLKYISRYL